MCIASSTTPFLPLLCAGSWFVQPRDRIPPLERQPLPNAYARIAKAWICISWDMVPFNEGFTPLGRLVAVGGKYAIDLSCLRGSSKKARGCVRLRAEKMQTLSRWLLIIKCKEQNR
ncbi:hypothetical protein GQ54DRAFT_221118 [Martensiomyces pterosporus]|nr:hypothetical protein GQ54DRAFT_221118 [Martensiomyces pterosporus]